MNEMTPAARERMDNYLQRLRNEMRGTRSVAADEIEQSVREHIEIELARATGPIGTAEVLGVLDRLGPPERWLADEEQSTWRQLAGRLGETAGESRLAYFAFGLFLASLALFQLFGPLLILPAMIASRAAVEIARERGEALGARKWLVYPSIAVVLVIAVVLLIIGPPARLVEFAIAGGGFAEMFDLTESTVGEPRVAIGVGGVVFGAWWILAGAFCAAFLRPIRFAFAPLLDGVGRKHFAVLAAIGAVTAAAGAALIFR